MSIGTVSSVALAPRYTYILSEFSLEGQRCEFLFGREKIFGRAKMIFYSNFMLAWYLWDIQHAMLNLFCASHYNKYFQEKWKQYGGFLSSCLRFLYKTLKVGLCFRLHCFIQYNGLGLHPVQWIRNFESTRASKCVI